MTQSNAKDFLPLIEAWSRGETLQYKNYDGKWLDAVGDLSLKGDAHVYRIKPKPLELWVNVFPNGLAPSVFEREDAALDSARTWSENKPRTVHMREVTT